ncbi:MAG: hypothetical protein QOI59_4767 [Gammaproteobacteria bacterium]|nr:hypothetical protein [Gammaproteobacteria bacterium]
MRSVPSSILCKAMVGALVAFGVAGCATDRLDAAAPSGVNLTGDWKLNLNLSDDPDKLGPDPDKSTPQRAPGTHRGHGGGGRGGGGGMPPVGSPPDGTGNYEFGPTASNDAYGPASGAYAPTSGAFVHTAADATPTASDFVHAVSGTMPTASDFARAANGRTAAAGDFIPVALSAPGIEQSAPLPPTTGTAAGTTGAKPSRGASINRILRAPLTMSITQDKSTVTVKANMPDGAQTSDEYAAGTKTTIPFGQDQTAERTSGWRGPVFVVTTVAKKFGTREDDFAIDDDDGRLIMTTQTKGGRLGKVEIKRVYDRVKSVQP